MTGRSPDALLDALARSAFRRRFALERRDRDLIAAKGLPHILAAARTLIDRRLAPAAPPREGRQTPFGGHPVFVAQHATATCCRGCLARWHAIPKGRCLTEGERQAVVDVIGRWLARQPAGDGPRQLTLFDRAYGPDEP